MALWDDFKEARERGRSTFAQQSSFTLSVIMIGLGAFLILGGLFVPNPLVKGFIVAWVVLP